MQHAVTHHPRMVLRWAEFAGRFNLLRSVLRTSLSLTLFIPTDENVAMYRNLAQAELLRIRGGHDNSLRCLHLRQEHIDALNGILKRFPGPVLQ